MGECTCGTPSEAAHYYFYVIARESADTTYIDGYACGEHVPGYEVGDQVEYDGATWEVLEADVTELERPEYRVWKESGDLIHAGPDRDEAERWMGEAITEHIAYAECGGCGVLTAPEHHGFTIQICLGDEDVTGAPNY